ncbi:Pentatricopeptide repeat-containing protein [Apostasia shenzhenica]|uniref:Pentatricopeptide repeat-containing protein n=1 Tax=Apostasia shenzhenica TaxID=1088818 RepID=A0A2I0BEE5_9ASPA|nr:Pentatricopeptide repeat-containing protein [Apostasia shenzhenica]
MLPFSPSRFRLLRRRPLFALSDRRSPTASIPLSSSSSLFSDFSNSPFFPLPSHLFSSATSSTTTISDSSDHKDLNYIASTHTQDSLIYVLKKLSKMPQKALTFFNLATTQYGLRPGPAAYDLMLRILAHKDHMADFWAFLISMQKHGHVLDESSYSVVLSSFKQQKLAAEAAALTKFYSRAAEESSIDIAVKSAAEVLLDAEQWNKELEKKLEDLRLSLSEYSVAKILLEVRNFPIKALGFFRWAAQMPDYEHGSVAYNAMSRVLVRQESIGEFWSFLKEMKEKGYNMDIDTYVKLTRQFLKRKMMTDVVQLYEFMMDGPYMPAIQDCGMLLRQISLSPIPDLDLVYRVVKKYEAAGYSLSKVVYDGIHRSLTSIGKFEEAVQIMKKMRENGFEPDNITYSQLVHGLCKAKRLDEASKVLEEMEEGGCEPDLKTWTVLIQGHCSAGEVDRALECLAKLIEKKLETDADLLDVLVKGLCSKNRRDSAYKLLVEMVDNARVRPWQATYKFLIQELLAAGKLEEALKLLSSMKTFNFPPFAEPFSPFLSKSGTTEDAKEFLKILSAKTYPSVATYLNLFKCFFEQGRYPEAQDLLFKCPHHIRKHEDISKLFGSIK